MSAVLRVTVIALCVLLAAVLAWLAVQLPPAPQMLQQEIAARLADSGVTHPVTAVLLNFRAHDTLLEVGVLLLATMGALALRDPEERRPHRVQAPADVDPVLRNLIQVGVPVMVLTAGYLLWAGTRQPGGAFQAAAVLAGAGILVHLARLAAPTRTAEGALRALIAAGFAVFLAAGVAMLVLQGSMLEYPLQAAGTFIPLIETALTVSIAMGLVSLFLAAPDIEEEDR